MNKLILIIFLFMLFPFVSSAPPFQTSADNLDCIIEYPKIEYIKLDNSYNFNIHVINGTTGKILTDSAISCFLHIYDNTGEHIYTNNSLYYDSDDSDFKALIPSSIFASPKSLTYIAQCNNSVIGCFISAPITSTYNGEKNADDNFTIFIYLIFIIASIGLVYTFFLGLAKLAMADTTIYDVLLSWGFYILMIFSYYISQYLLSNFVYDLSKTFLNVFVWTNGLLPLISLIITIFIKGMQKKKPLSINELAGRRLAT